ncbi:site-specific integrase [Arenibacter sp. M-2]|uniref:site-specific integrase n=1 Tax=Arenibacter sp. M-2 TaxID=3053612 RepID=UPI00257090A0|nr:site-specific integrase [Arenibacter sp. M-2]MDL5510514.1 site-specific integrase [Arenibacter sp. M-2]|tara:strand:- start:4110 stop:5327 length:1218 start_codon:yes stop_codon:yes gene_type:complete
MNTNVKLSLDTRRQKKDTSYPIILRLSHLRKTTSISLGQSVQKEYWDDKNERIKRAFKGTSSVSKLNNQLLKEKTRAVDIVNELYEKDELNFLSILQLKSKIVKTASFDSFLEYSKSIVKDLKRAEHFGNANTYYAVTKVLERFNGGNDIKFNEVNYDFLKRFESWHFSRGNSVNSLSAYMRTIKAIFNKAIKSDVVSREAYPFTHYRIKTTPTEKRALDINSMKSIMLLKLEKTDSLFHYRNFFLASYMLYGISFMDLAFLKVQNIIDRRIKFQRKKTYKPYDISITPQLKEILSYYLKDKEKSEYIFPIIKRETFELQYKDVVWARKRYNKGLKEIANKCNIEQRLTSYVSRHSFATQAMLQDVPLQAISAMLGHNRLSTTQIYLKSLPNDILDSYNKKLVEL